LSQDHTRVALVSDGSAAIGAAIVRRLAEAGWHVGFSYRADERSARAVEQAAARPGTRVTGTRVDLADPAQVTAWTRRAAADLGPVRALVVCAGVTRDRPLTLLSDADWLAVIATSLPEVIRAAARHGIRVNAIVPGAPGTDAGLDLSSILPGRTRAALTETVALRRFAAAADVADLALHLLSAQAATFTGRTLHPETTQKTFYPERTVVLPPGPPGRKPATKGTRGIPAQR
jgi:NAD(P)-dependent dehydrogenase (short-subunit alcohol dehydrogenase family)